VLDRAALDHLDATRLAAAKAYFQAGIARPRALEGLVVEAHDAFNSLLPIDLADLELVDPDDAVAALVGDLAVPPFDPLAHPISGVAGRAPINLSGGLKARGHPVGGTGLFQIAECALQLLERFPNPRAQGARPPRRRPLDRRARQQRVRDGARALGLAAAPGAGHAAAARVRAQRRAAAPRGPGPARRRPRRAPRDDHDPRDGRARAGAAARRAGRGGGPAPPREARPGGRGRAPARRRARGTAGPADREAGRLPLLPPGVGPGL